MSKEDVLHRKMKNQNTTQIKTLRTEDKHNFFVTLRVALGTSSRQPKMVLQNDIDLLNPPAELEKKKHKLKRLVQSPNSFFMEEELDSLRDALSGRRVIDLIFCYFMIHKNKRK
ncbi:hypothetical protein J1N35_009662 [Gossypium stocksii]|uniref:Uncharacterized protein n=1 Tax=Gossypium stocksii TaxID=47602 RepID=A0A9D3VZ25_9ROSI|nr:hypothetical protein J1N35_009662 [Gossypium stocksii]